MFMCPVQAGITKTDGTFTDESHQDQYVSCLSRHHTTTDGTFTDESHQGGNNDPIQG